MSSPVGLSPSTSISSLSNHFDLSTLSFRPALFSSHLRTALLGRFLQYHSIASSTQDLARSAAEQGQPTGTLILAEEQTKGRGRVEGRVWVSEKKGNLYFTLILNPLAVTELAKINFAICLAVATAIKEQGVDARVKWPNDVWINNRKAAGVLVDVDITGTAIGVFAGVGINVNQDIAHHPDPALQAIATSISDAAGKPIEREVLLAAILNQLELLLTKPMTEILRLYRQFDCLAGNEVIVMPKKKENKESYYTGIAVGFTDEGYLKVKVADQEIVLVSEEVTIKMK